MGDIFEHIKIERNTHRTNSNFTRKLHLSYSQDDFEILINHMCLSFQHHVTMKITKTR